MIFSKFKYKISPRALCVVTLRIFKITKAGILHKRCPRLRQIGLIGLRPALHVTFCYTSVEKIRQVIVRNRTYIPFRGSGYMLRINLSIIRPLYKKRHRAKMRLEFRRKLSLRSTTGRHFSRNCVRHGRSLLEASGMLRNPQSDCCSVCCVLGCESDGK